MASVFEEQRPAWRSGLMRRLRATLRVVAEVLESPRLRRVCLAFLVFNAIEAGTWVVILLYAYEATGPASVGVVALAQLLPAAFAAPLAATLGDDHPRGRVLLAGYLLIAGALGLTAVAMLEGWPPLVVYASAMAASTSIALVRPAQNAILPELAYSPAELTAANAVSSIAEALGILVGPLAVAAILAVSNHGSALGAGAVAMATAAALVASFAAGPRRVPDPRWQGVPAGATPWSRYRRQVREGFAALASDRAARVLVFLLGSRMLMIGITDVLFVLLAIELFGMGEEGAALLAAALGAGGVIGGALSFMLVGQPSFGVVIAACALAWGVALALLGQAFDGYIAVLLAVAGGTGLAVLDVASRTFLQRAVRHDVLTRVFGIVEGMSLLVLAAGSVLVTGVVAMVGLRDSVLVFACLLPLAVLAVWPALSRLDARTLVPQRELALLHMTRLFEALPPPTLEAVARTARWERAPAGRVVIREGEPGKEYFVLEAGVVVASRQGQFLRRLGARGDGFGEIALLKDVPRTASVTAERDAVLLVIDRDAFLGALDGHSAASAAAEQVVEARLHDRD